jgi:hypothetical protein
MLSTMTHAQFDEWCAFDLIEPIGERGTNDILARLAVMIASYLGQKEAKESMFAWWKKDPNDKPVKEDVAIAMLEMIGGRRTDGSNGR